MTPQDKKRLDAALAILIHHILSSSAEQERSALEEVKPEPETKQDVPIAGDDVSPQEREDDVLLQNGVAMDAHSPLRERATTDSPPSLAKSVKQNTSTAKKRGSAQLSLFPTQTE